MKEDSKFGLEINKYLNQYIAIADAKAAGLVTASLTLAGFTYLNLSTYCFSWILTLSYIMYAVCIILCTIVLFPRLTSRGNSLIFWEDIDKNFSSPEKYYMSIKSLNNKKREREYSYQNFYISKILHKKYMAIRISSIIFLIAGGLTFYNFLF